MRTLLDSGTDKAALAIAMFCHRLRAYLGAYLAVLSGADAILFGGGIGESAPVIRERVLEHFDWAGIRLDATRNGAVNPSVGGRVHANDSAVQVWVIPTDEARVMADGAQALLELDVTETPDLLETAL